MYQPASFREDRPDILYATIRAHPLATVVTAGTGGLIANLVPVTIATEGLLHIHMVRANEQLAALREGAETLLIFQGPQAYISPSWYASKAEHGKVVPTWNYVVVQARGRPQVVDDDVWLKNHVTSLTRDHELIRQKPWEVSDAPEAFIDDRLKSIVGVEIQVHNITGKWKVSQNRSDADRIGVAEGLDREGRSDMADLVRTSSVGSP
jgi:transcriptional regulator